MLDLEQGVLRPLQRKVKNITGKVESEEKKIRALDG